MINFSFIIPSRNNFDKVNSLINNPIISNNESIIIDDYSDPPHKYIKNSSTKIIYNKKKQSLSRLWNQGINESQYDDLIILSDRFILNKNNFNTLLSLQKNGHLLIAIAGFHFVYINKNLIQKIGGFEESFTHGGYEDADFLNRCLVHDVGILLHSLSGGPSLGSSGWSDSDNRYKENKVFYNKKWSNDLLIPHQNIKDSYNIKFKYPIQKQLNQILNFSHSIIPNNHRLYSALSLQQ